MHFLGVILGVLNVARAEEFTSFLPPTEQLRTIETTAFQLIYPTSAESQAQQAASALDWMVHELSRDLSEPPPQISIILNNQTTLGNGFVGMLPHRSAWYLSPIENDPSVFGSSATWLEQLALHEYRHVVQGARTLQGGASWMYMLLGEGGWSLVNGLSQPTWFTEGDAVAVETLFSLTGRGRSPGFSTELVALYEQAGPLHLETMIHGSFEEPIPDHYRLGWLMVRYGLLKYGPNFWNDVSDHAAKWWFLPFSFERGVKKYAGMELELLYQESAADLQKRWMLETGGRKHTPVTVLLTPENETGPIGYHSPIIVEGGIMVIRSSQDSLDAIVLHEKEGKTKTVATLGERSGHRLGGNTLGVLWEESIEDPFWPQASSSDIYMFDLKKNKRSRLTRGGRYFSPDENDKGEIAALELGLDGRSTIVLIDPKTGYSLEKFPLLDGDAHDLRWSETGRSILFIKRGISKGNSVFQFDLETSHWEQLLPWYWEPISDPTLVDDWLLFVYSSAHGEEIRAISLESKQQYRVATRPYGLTDIVTDGETLYATELVYGGKRLISMPFAPNSWTPIAGSPERDPLKEIRRAFDTRDLLSTIPPKEWESNPYRRGLHLIQFHTWTPIISPNKTTYGLEALNNDITESLHGRILGHWNIQQSSPTLELGLRYSAIWPELEGIARMGEKMVTVPKETLSTTSTVSDSNPMRVRWNEQWWQGWAHFPLHFSRGPWDRGLTFSIGGGISYFGEVALKGNDNETDENDWMERIAGFHEPIEMVLSLDNHWRMAPLDLRPRWGINAFGNIYSDLSLPDAKGWGIAISATTPAPFRQGTFGVEVRHFEQNTLMMAPPFEEYFPRGYAQEHIQSFSRLQVDHRFILATPDLRVSRWLYLKRLHGGVFWDMGMGPKGTTINSIGGNLLMDIFPMRFPVMFSDIGVDFGWLVEREHPFVTPSISGIF